MDDSTWYNATLVNHLVTPDERQLSEIFRGTVQEWSGGLDLPRYETLQREVLSWPAARERYRYRALIDEAGAVLASFKCYRFAAQWGGRALVAVGVGAVYTPIERRGKGHAQELLTRALAEERDGGAQAALLFSDIGPRLYERLGFGVVPSAAVEAPLSALPLPSAECMARDATLDDLDRIAAILAARPVGAAFAISRTAGTVRLLFGRMARALAAHGVEPPAVGAIAPGGAALWVGFPGRPLTILDLWAEDEETRRSLLMRARVAAEDTFCTTINAWAVGGVAPFGAAKERTTGLAMIASLGADGPKEALLAGLDHF